MAKHKKLKLTDTKDRGFKGIDWLELGLLIGALLLSAAIVLAFIVAGLKIVTEVAL